jgi:hypothetical protein
MKIDFQTLIIIGLECAFAFIIFMFVAWILHRTFILKLQQRYGIDADQQAFSLYMGGLLLSLAQVLTSAGNSFVSTMKILSHQFSFYDLAMSSGGYLLILLLSAVLMVFILHYSTTYIYRLLYQKALFEDLAQGKMGAAIFAVASLLSVSMLFKDNIAQLLESLAPYPKMIGVGF